LTLESLYFKKKIWLLTLIYFIRLIISKSFIHFTQIKKKCINEKERKINSILNVFGLYTNKILFRKIWLLTLIPNTLMFQVLDSNQNKLKGKMIWIVSPFRKYDSNQTIYDCINLHLPLIWISVLVCQINLRRISNWVYTIWFNSHFLWFESFTYFKLIF